MKSTVLILLVMVLSVHNNFAQINNFQIFYSGFNGPVTAITENNSGNIWVAVWSLQDDDSTNQVVLIDEQIIDTVSIYSRYPFWDIEVDQNNVLWVAT